MQVQFPKTNHISTKDLESTYKIRKLTPLETWRLMGFDDIDFYKAKYILNKTFYNERDRSNSQLYKMAGNSIVVNVLIELFRHLFTGHYCNKADYNKKLKLLENYYGINNSEEMVIRLTNERFSQVNKEHPAYFRRKTA